MRHKRTINPEPPPSHIGARKLPPLLLRGLVLSLFLVGSERLLSKEGRVKYPEATLNPKP